MHKTVPHYIMQIILNDTSDSHGEYEDDCCRDVVQCVLA
jgi:hypothetical protein